MKAVLIDDERLARQELRHLLEAHKDLITIVGEASNGKEGIELIKNLSPDLIFLDIQMPEMTGFEMLKQLNEIPKVVFVTAYDDYAIDAFKVNALDYLMKPVEPQLLKETIEKLEQNSEEEFLSTEENSRSDRKLNVSDNIFIKDGEKCFFPKLKDVRYFESQGNYVRVFFNESKPMILRSLNALQDKLSSEDFFRANRKYLINLNHIESIENWFNGGLKVKLTDQMEIEVSRRQTIRFKEIMML
ncbi:LytR/AlgR family response regulator transcription factor [Brumimicrobium mesophilum]|uniref:LytR/AlgR family response regulator transcription factor n=1 Tax=Brumimicrobium mesophilum TaxID=392717 RepID=UPI000D14242B|nr:LytTR family DNA-binding domain-containing protein [Brumimicrobium mesophilum]